MEEDSVDLETVNLLPRLQRLLKCIREHNLQEIERATSALSEEVGRLKATVDAVPGADMTEQEQQALIDELTRKIHEQDAQLQAYRDMIAKISPST